VRVLIVRLSALGDVVCSSPVAAAIRKSYPQAEIVWVADRRFAGIVECSKAVDQVLVVSKSWRDARQEIQGLGEFDFALDLQGLLKSGALVGAAHAKTKLGYHWQREGAWLFSSRVVPDPTSIHIVDQYVDVARAVGADVDEAEFALVPKEEDIDSVRMRLREKGIDPSQPFAIVNAGAGWATKRWPASDFAYVANAIINGGGQVAFIGTEADRPGFDAVRDDAPEVIDFLGQTNVRELVALCSIAALHIGGDTGSTHLSASVGTPCIGLYTLTRPERSCPYGQLANCLDLDRERVAANALAILGKVGTA